MTPETEENIQLLREKGLSIREIKKVLNLSNHDLYDSQEEVKSEEPIQKTKPIPETENSKGFSSIKIASNNTVNDLAKQQERCLIKLIEHIKTPFKDKWDYAEWHREAIALQLGQTNHNRLMLDSEAIWGNLLEGRGTEAKREWIIFMMHNHLEILFSFARTELAERERIEE